MPVMIVTQLCEYSKNHWIVQSKASELYGMKITAQQKKCF